MFFERVESVHGKVPCPIENVGAPPSNGEETVLEECGPECWCIVVGVDDIDETGAWRFGEDVLRGAVDGVEDSQGEGACWARGGGHGLRSKAARAAVIVVCIVQHTLLLTKLIGASRRALHHALISGFYCVQAFSDKLIFCILNYGTTRRVAEIITSHLQWKRAWTDREGANCTKQGQSHA